MYFMFLIFFLFIPPAITPTLGVPQLPEDWGNDRVLTFMRFMWAHWRSQDPDSQANGDAPQGDSRGPAPPSTVATSAKKAFLSLSESEDAKLRFQAELIEPEASPVLPVEAAILVRSVSGQNLQIPSWDDALKSIHNNGLFDGDWSSDTDSLDCTSYAYSSQGSLNDIQNISPERRNKNLLWLRQHFQSLNEVGGLVFNNADLWQLHQYFFSPVYNSSDDGDASVKDDLDTSDKEENEPPSPPSDSASETTNAPPPTPVIPSKRSKLGRAISFQTLGAAVAAAAVGINSSGPNKRRSDEETPTGQEPCAKRAKNLKSRIAYYPRIREQLESLGAKPSAQTLSLLRQLKYIESVMLKGKNCIYSEQEDEEADEGPNSMDVEMILLDLL